VPSTLVDLLRRRAEGSPGRVVYTFLAGADAEATGLSFGELDARARAIAALLQSVAPAGERVLLLYPPGLEYVEAFFGCLYAGLIAVPAYPPRLSRANERLQSMAEDARATVALTTSAVLTRSRPMLDRGRELKSLRWLATDDVETHLADAWRPPAPEGDSLAYLQYTSGSTSAPKGVMVSHENVLHNCAYINHGFGHTADSVSLSWLPHFHDMGLIEGVVQPVYSGMHGLLMPPALFLQRPSSWLQAITRYRVTHSGGPNFAYDLCLRKVGPEQREALDLSSWVVAYNGAEPVRKDTIERFAAAFGPCGFSRSAFYPAYGLAESTLKVCGGLKGEGPVYFDVRADALERNRVADAAGNENGGARSLVGSGRAMLDTEIAIVDPETMNRCAPDEVGEVWVSSPSVARGYWNKPEETERTFRARLPGPGRGLYLRTGDLGFLKDGELFVTGRLKDLIIIRGRNHYPQDIERTVEQSHPALRPNSGAAFSVDDGEERLVIVQELDHRRRADANEVIEAIRRAVAESHEVDVSALALVKVGGVPKTSSGKVRRGACRGLFLEGRFEAAAMWRVGDVHVSERPEAVPATPAESREALEAWLASRLAAKLSVDPAEIDLRKPLAEYGLDSLAAVELMHGIEVSLGLSLPMASILYSPTISDLAAQAATRGPALSTGPKPALSQSGEVVTEHPLSRGQQALWFLHQISPESAAYNIAVAVRIKGDLDVSALRQTFEMLAARHPCLRSSFASALGEPIQLIHEKAEVFFQREDVVDWDDARFGGRLVEEARRPFDLERGPLLRLYLFARSSDENVLLLVVHHIVADFWSLAVLVDEMGALYEAEKDGRAVMLAPLDFQYADYVRWQEETLAGAEGERLWAYWQEQLSGELPSLALPTDRPRPPAQTYAGASHSFRLEQELAAAVQALGRSRGATLYMTMLASFLTLLHRYTGQEDITVGSPTSGRSSAGLAGLVGYFVNPVVIRADFSGNPTFEQFLCQARETVRAAFEHQDYPFALLVKRIEPERDASRPPLFQSMFVLQKSHLHDEEGLAAFALGEAGGRLKLGALDLESMALERRVAQFDLTLSIAEAQGTIPASLEYNTDLFDAITIERMAGHFHTLVEALARDPFRPVSDLPLMTLAQQRQLLAEWNDTYQSAPENRCVHELFEAWAVRTPDADAVVFGHSRLTYRGLNDRANQLASVLRGLGVGPESRVALLLERSLEMVVSLFAILKAGAAYVPLGATIPTERLAFMLEDSRAEVVLTEERLADRLPEKRPKIICPDIMREPLAAANAGDLEGKATASNLAYIIYTSGSTGAPKGVMIEHRTLVRYIEWMGDRYEFGPGDRFLQFSSVSFDASVEDIFGSLTRGATLVLPAESAMGSASSFVDECRKHEVTVVNLPTAYWHELVVNTTSEDWASIERLRVFIVGGERALAGRLRDWREIAGRHVRFANEYGPTEATICSTAWEPAHNPDVELGEIPIGRPIRNVRAYILDRRLRPVPIGVVGELHIGGLNLARGYHERPDLTAEKFIPNPFSDEPGGRLYKTGDLARYLPGGDIEFAGRTDHQVKVRGFRIELGEVEAALGQHPLVADVAVLAKEAASGALRLVAYVAANDDALTMGDLRGFARKKLPDYMVPSTFVLLDRLPLTPAGKLNYRALPEPAQTATESGAAFAAAHSAAEKQLAKIWADVLKLEQVGVHDNFFELGGDSILSIQVVARAREAGLDISPKQIFECPTVAELASVAGLGHTGQAEQGPVTGESPLTPIQRWFFRQRQPDIQHWNMAALFETREELDPARLAEALNRLLEHHDSLRLRFVETPSGWRQHIAAPGGDAPLRVVDLSELHTAERGIAFEYAAAGAQASLDLTNGPIIRAVLFRMGCDAPGRLLMIVHHLGVDAVSWRILMEDFEAAYMQLRRGARAELPGKTTSFKRWAERLNEFAGSDAVRGEADYWLNEIGGGVDRLPVDFRDGANLEESASTVSCSLGEWQTRRLLRDVPEVYHTQINDALLAALAEAFARWTGRGPLLVEMEGHGREEIIEGVDLSRTAGWFTTAFPVKLAPGASFKPGEALKGAKERLRRVPNRGIGYGLLRYACADAEAADKVRSLPEPEVSFNYLGQLDQSFSGLRLLKPISGAAGRTRSGRAKRSHLIEINAGVIGGRLQLEWVYSENTHRRETIARLANEFIEALGSIIDHCLSDEAGGHTPSDFPLAGLDQRRLDELMASVGNVEDIYPLSPAQQGMLFHSLYAPHSAVYVGQLTLTLKGNLDKSALERAWLQVVNRHTALRSTFAWEGLDEPLQVVRKDVSLSLVEEDWREAAAAEQAARLQSFLESDRRLGFDLTAPPLMRQALIRLSEDSYQLVWTHHHLLLDGWSMSLVLEEVFPLYEAFVGGPRPRLGRSRPYRDYIAWLGRQDERPAELFWRESLKGLTGPTPLPAGRDDALAEGETGVERKRLPQPLTARLRSRARRRHLTLSTLIEAAWALLLARYSGERAVVFGTTVSGRPAALAGVEKMVGLFINTLPMRVEVRPGESPATLMKRIQSLQSEMRQYEFSPLVKIQEWCGLPRGVSLFDSIVAFENYPLNAEELKRGLSFDIIEARSFEKTNYPVALVVMPGPELMIEALYDGGRFDAAMVVRMLGHLETLLEQIAADAAPRVSDLSILTEQERRLLLVEFNDTRSDYPSGASLAELFERQVERTPDAIAVEFEGERLTYSELNARANRLANYLRKRGVGAETLVGISMGRSADMVVGMLGVLKSGGAYVPLDPTHPKQRLAFMLEDAGVKVTLSEGRLLERLPAHGAKVICLDGEWQEIARESEAAPRSGTCGDNLAYVMYTSGSTGAPKGVSITQGAISRLVINSNYVRLGPADGVAQVSNSSFDVSTFEVWGALLNGARLVVLTADIALSPRQFAGQLRDAQISVMFLTSSLFNEVARQAPDSLGSVRHLLVGGEAVDPGWCREVLAGGPPARLLNAYGPTESTTFALWQEVRSVDENAKTIPIGRPLSNTRAYVLDDDMNPLPAGVVGQLYIGGEGLARCYWNRPDLTAERFVPDPFGGDPGGRLYKTGDLVRHLEDGRVDYLGRNDHQVKLRGFRIELGEIESALKQMPGAREAIVLASGDAPADKRLVAYMVCGPGPPPTTREVRSFITERLPDYMAPSAVVIIDGLPLTPNGKLDRDALGRLGAAAPISEESYVAPRNSVEAAVAAIWAEILGIERVGAHDNFFDLGGHSLLATRVISGIRYVFKVDLPLKALFESATVAEMASAVIANESKPGQAQKIARVLEKMESLSAEDRDRMLREKRRGRTGHEGQ
jgi:amino acid adenylation domain-containing protein/non-ribosomal peptide synthase protein (TIGR01720 family)